MTFAQQDVWTPYYADTASKGKGKGPPTTSNAPEPATYGVLFVGLCLAVLVARRWRVRT